MEQNLKQKEETFQFLNESAMSFEKWSKFGELKWNNLVIA